MTAQERYPRLSSPIEIGGVRLRNRVAHAAIWTRYVPAQRVTERLLDYYEARAEGGVAMIISEPLGVLEWQAADPVRVRLYDDDEADGLKRWVESVEKHDTRLLGHIQDSGRGMHHAGRRSFSLSASALPDDLSWTVPHALEPYQIRRIHDDIAAAAARLQRAGFSGVEISAGHGHLIHQFLSPHSNIREDDYGGSLESRMRFLTEMIAAVRASTTKPFIVALKLPGNDGVKGGVDLAEAHRIVQALATLGEVDAMTFCQGSHHRTLEDNIPDMHWPRAPYNDIVKELRQSAGCIPVAALTRLVEPVQAEQALADEVADFVQIGRPLITEPNWLNNALYGRDHKSRLCVSCNTCWGLVANKTTLGCDNNPRVGTPGEAHLHPVLAKQRERVLYQIPVIKTHEVDSQDLRYVVHHDKRDEVCHGGTCSASGRLRCG